LKLLILYFLIPLISWQTCTINKTGTAEPTNSIGISRDTIDFISQVQPILVKKCSPCHFTGGKMYEKIPFDQGTTILNHEAGILKRFKNEEALLIKNFILQNKNGSSVDEPQE
jgi:hypothetical protein